MRLLATIVLSFLATHAFSQSVLVPGRTQSPPPVVLTVSPDRPANQFAAAAVVDPMEEEYTARPAPVYLLEESVETSRYGYAKSALEAVGMPYEVVEARDLPYISLGSIVLAVTEDGMETLLEQAGKTCRLYGIGYSAECLYQCANGRIEAIALWGDYTAAYTAVIAALGAAEGHATANMTLESYLVTADSMYEDPLSQILFPIS